MPCISPSLKANQREKGVVHGAAPFVFLEPTLNNKCRFEIFEAAFIY